MRDLELGRRIDAGIVTAVELRQLGVLPLTARAPLLRSVLRLLNSQIENDVRAAAVGLLSGARGMAAMRSVVAHLNDEDAFVRSTAMETLRVTARDAPTRFSHALFHRRDDVRRGALSGALPQGTGEIATYLRADPVCADLAYELPWPEPRFPLALDLHRMKALSDQALLDQLMQATPIQLREALERDYARNAQTVSTYLEGVAEGKPLSVCPGRDVIDAVLQAIAATNAWTKELRALVVAIARGKAKERPAKKDGPVEADEAIARGEKTDALVQRALVSILSHLAVTPHPQLWAAVVALDPTQLPRAPMRDAERTAIANGLFQFAWPMRVPRDRVLAMLASRPVCEDLSLAAAVAGWLPHEEDKTQLDHPVEGAKRRSAMSRLQVLSSVLGEDHVLDLLRKGTRGWRKLCRLPQESSATELRWLAQIRRWDPNHAAVLEGLALSVWRKKRLDSFITKLPEAQRPASLYALLQLAGLDRSDPHRLTVCTMFATRMDAAAFSGLLETLLTRDDSAHESALVVLRALNDKQIATIAKRLSDDVLARLVTYLDALPEIDCLPRSIEVALASVAADRTPALQAWARKITAPSPETTIVLPPNRAQRVLEDKDRTAIANAPDDSLLAALGPSVFTPTVGLVDALSRRRPMRSLSACCALLGSADPLPEVAQQLDRFAEFSPKFDGELDDNVALAWTADETVPPLVHARLWRWEAHTAYLATWIEHAGGVFRALQAIDGLEGRLAKLTLWRGIAEVVVLLRYRDKPRFLLEASVDLARFAAERVGEPHGVQAARVVVALVEGGAVRIDEVRAILLAKTPDAAAGARDQLSRLIRMDGMPTPPPVTAVLAPSAMLEKIRSTRDLEALEEWCADSRSGVALEAALAMASLGALGQQRLARMLPRIGDYLAPVAILSTVALWDDPDALAAAQELAAHSDLAPEWQFHLCLGVGDFDRAIAAVHAPESMPFKRADWDALAKLRSPIETALRLVDAPQHHAYWPSIELLLQQVLTTEVKDGLVRFLEVDQARPLHLRRDAAELMVIDGDPRGIAILVEKMIEGQSDHKALLVALPSQMHALLAEAFVDVALIAGHGACSEKRVIALLDEIRPHRKLDPEVDGRLATRLLDEAQTKVGRKYGATRAVSEREASSRMRQVAEVFAWGIRRGVELTGRLMRFHLTSEQKDFGYTFLDGNQVYVSALPMLRGEPNGLDVVEGLVLHELGHHAYHRGEEPQAIWKKAHEEGLGHLLNLIADEHLERNLRGVQPEYGDRLKRLGSYAFQHAPQEIKVTSLLQSMRGSSARALIGTELDVAFDEDAVRLRRGAILAQLEKHGHPLARFSRALRMNLGNRWSDPLVTAALDLVPKDLKRLTMREMYELTKKLAEMFGGATACAKVFGGAEGLEFGERDDDVFSGGLDDAILQREVDRILDPNQGKGGGKKGKPDRLAINVNPDEQFAHITDVRHVQGDKGRHRDLVMEVARHSTRLRQHLDELGLRWLPVKARTKGHALDRSRLRPLITHGDPRILQARTPIRRTDLFLGTVIDCSGSMQAGQNIERAKKFAVLIAEAVRDLPGVDARFFGFTDTVIFDAGDAHKCEVTALTASGGNNDAAALYHVASVAASSQKRARVLVMISDGLPTQCSVAALRGLVTTLTRRKGMVCAQVAVRKLEEECFPHHVLLDDAQVDTAVAKFGRMIGDLTRRALGS